MCLRWLEVFWGKVNVLLSPSSVHLSSVFKDVLRCLEDWEERLLWKEVRGTRLGRRDDRGFGHDEGMQTVESWTQKGKAMELTLPTIAEELLSCLRQTRSLLA